LSQVAGDSSFLWDERNQMPKAQVANLNNLQGTPEASSSWPVKKAACGRTDAGIRHPIDAAV